MLEPAKRGMLAPSLLVEQTPLGVVDRLTRSAGHCRRDRPAIMCLNVPATGSSRDADS